MTLLSVLAFFMFSVGAVGLPTSLIGNTVGKHLGETPEGDDDTPMNRWAYTTYGGFSHRRTLFGSAVLLAVGATLMAALWATGNFTLQ